MGVPVWPPKDGCPCVAPHHPGLPAAGGVTWLKQGMAMLMRKSHQFPRHVRSVVMGAATSMQSRCRRPGC